jgi:hypothetical protein
VVAVTTVLDISVIPASVEVRITVPVLVWEEIGRRVRALEDVGVRAGERIQPITELPSVTIKTASSTSATDKPSHCRPAIILACRVR